MAPRLWTCFGNKGSRDGEEGNMKSEDQQGCAGAVVVEMFSSQGCAMSLAAELVLSRLGRGDFQLEMPLVLLAFHVDYWDYMGWKDPYGSSQWTVRQKAYVESLGLDTLLTPQVVVQGVAHCVGNDENALVDAINNATRYPAPTFQATFAKPTQDSLQVSLTGALRSKVDSNGVNIMVALYENGLVTDCPRGENKGRVLSNDFVVRKLEKLCTEKDISANKTITATVSFPLWGGFNSTKCGLAIFLQTPSHQIFGSQSFQLPDHI